MSDASGELTPVRFSRLGRRRVLLGLGRGQLAAVGVGVIVLVVSFTIGGFAGAAVTTPIWGAGAALAWLPIGGRPMVSWLPTIGHWMLRRSTGQTDYRKRPSRPRPAGTLALPGDAAPLRQILDPNTGTVFVHDPYAATLTAVLDVRHRSFALLDGVEQERRVRGWGNVLATVCRSGRIARLQVMERTIPDSGTTLSEWWASHGVHDASWASTTYESLIQTAGPAGERHVTTIALALDMKVAQRAIHAAGGGRTGAVRVMTQEMTTFTTALRAAELQPGPWYTPPQLAELLRTAYDPAATGLLDGHPDLGRMLDTAGPLAVAESWDHLRTDSAHHAVYWISEWPRSRVYPGFLAPLVLTPALRRTISILYQPVPTDIAARRLRRQRVGHLANEAQRARLGRIGDAATDAEYNDLLEQESELAQGHGFLRYVGLIAVTAPDADALDASCGALEQAVVQAGCECRRLVGQQAQAFTAAALPLARAV